MRSPTVIRTPWTPTAAAPPFRGPVPVTPTTSPSLWTESYDGHVGGGSACAHGRM